MRDKEESTELAAGKATGMLFLQLCGLALSFGVQVLLTRNLEVSDYGTFVYAVRWLGLLVLLVQSGLAAGAIRFVPGYVVKSQWSRLSGYLRLGWRWIMGASLIFAGLVWVGLSLVEGTIPGKLALALLWVLLGLPFLGLLQLWTGTLRALGQVARSQVAGLVVRPLIFAAGIACVTFLAGVSLDSLWALGLYLVAIVGSLLLVGLWLHKALPSAVRHAHPTYAMWEWSRVLPPLLLQNLLGMLIQRLDILMIGLLLGVREVALYAIASRVAGLLVFGRKAVNAWAVPEISRYHASADEAGLRDLIRRSSRLILSLSLPMGLLLLAGSQFVLRLFGPAYVEAQVVLLILLLGHLLGALFGPASFLLTMTGSERLALAVSSTVVVLTGLLLSILIPLWGLAGAAIAALFSRLFYHLGMTTWAWKKHGIRATPV